MPESSSPFSGLANARKLTEQELVRAVRFMVAAEFDASNREILALRRAGVEDVGMKTFRPYQPDQLLLLPPSIQEWLPEGHLARFVGEVVDELDLSAIEVRYNDGSLPRSGAAQQAQRWRQDKGGRARVGTVSPPA